MVSERAARLLQTSIVWDNHTCMPLRPEDESFLPQLARHRAAGAHAVTVNVCFDAVPWQTAPEMLAAIRRWVSERPQDYLLVETADEIEAARSSGRLAVLFDIEGGTALNGKLDAVKRYYDLGVRWMLIAYNRNNALGGGCQDDDRGLTDFGRSVIAEMERVGMVVCCSHTGLRTAMEVMERSTNPVIFSHSNAVAIHKHKRNIPDDAIRACARTGGVVGINGIGIFLGPDGSSTRTFVDHVQHVADLVGPQHVGLSLDYVFDTRELEEYLAANRHIFPASEGYTSTISMVEPERIPAVVEELLNRGFDEDTIRGILGGNWMRIARTVWKRPEVPTMA
jgi:membrane dipeptidase